MLKHVRGDFGQLRTTKTEEVFSLELRNCECVRFEHGRIVQSEHRRGYPGTNGLPVPCQLRSNYSLWNRRVTCV